jgi:hypothetical protein
LLPVGKRIIEQQAAGSLHLLRKSRAGLRTRLTVSAHSPLAGTETGSTNVYY